MTNSYPAGSPGLPDASMPTGAPGFMPRRSSYASVVSGAATGHSYPRSGAFSHLLNQHIDSSFDPAYQTLSGHLRNDPRAYDMDFGANGSGHGRSGSWTRGGQLPSFSSAFGSLVNGYGYAGIGSSMDHFFVPSYLKGSKYVQKLEEAHRAKVTAHRDGHSAHSSQPGSLSTSASSANLHSKMAPSHRGMTYDVIEKAPPMEDESLPPLPSKWNSQDKHAGVEVLSEGQEVKFTGSKSDRDRDHEASAIRADHPMPPQCGIYYYEVTIVSRKREESSIGIGFSSKTVPLSRLPGWEPDSWAYHGDDGNSFCCQSVGKQYGPPFTAGDVIGCGVNFRTGSAFFTKNGDYLGPAFREINNKGKLYPSVGMKKSGEHIRVNFGQSPFVFDIDGMMLASNNSHSLPPSSQPPPSSSSNLLLATANPDEATTPEESLPEYHSSQHERSGANSSVVPSTDAAAGNQSMEELGNILDPEFHAYMDSMDQQESNELGLETQHNLESPPLLPEPTLSTPQTSTADPNSISRIRMVPRSHSARPHIPIASLSSIRDAAQTEFLRRGPTLEYGNQTSEELFAQMRGLVAEGISNNGLDIVHADLSPQALLDLNGIVRTDLRDARGREEMMRRRAQFQGQQERFRSQERAERSQDESQRRRSQSPESTDPDPRRGERPLQGSSLRDQLSTEVAGVMGRFAVYGFQDRRVPLGASPDPSSVEPNVIATDEAALQQLTALQQSLIDIIVARHGSLTAGLNALLTQEDLEAARLLDLRSAQNNAPQTHMMASGTSRRTGLSTGQVRSHMEVSNPNVGLQTAGPGLRRMGPITRNPAVLSGRRGDILDTNTQNPRDIRNMTDIKIQQEKSQIRQDIDATSTSKIAPPMSETELIQSLVLQFLTHDGYVETARAFADEVHAEKRALSLDPNAVVHGFDVREDEDAGYRQRIRAAVLEGDVDKALKHTNAHYPHVLKDNEHVYFRLRCRKFIEMIRQGAEMQNAATNSSKKSSGHNGDWYDDILNHDMELDDHQTQNNNWDRMDTEETSEHQAEYQRLLEDTLAYGRDLQAEFKDDQRREVSKALEDAFALMAYTDPLNAKEVSHQLDPSGRVAVAEELNSAILQSLGKSSSAALEQLYQQTSILLEDLREGGGPGAFVNIDDFVRPKP